MTHKKSEYVAQHRPIYSLATASPWRDREVIQRIQYQIHNVRLSLFSISGHMKDKTYSALCFVTFFMGERQLI